MPDWWDESCENDPALLPDIEFRIARFLGLPITMVQNPGHLLAPPSYSGAQLRQGRNIERERLAPAIHSAMQIASAVVRNLEEQAPILNPLPTDGNSWRDQIQTRNTAIKLEDVLADLWKRGIPVVSVEILPEPSFQGFSCIIDGRPVIIIGHKHDIPSRVAFFIAHEAGHIAAGDCTPESPVVDDLEQVQDDEMEIRAENYAIHLMFGNTTIPTIQGGTANELAEEADNAERLLGVDAGVILFAWARDTGDYAKATMAVKALYEDQGARHLIRENFDRHVDLEGATESDRALLSCVFGDPERDAITH